jgi:hypothetical protein
MRWYCWSKSRTFHVLVLPEGAGLREHGVDERRLPVVDVGDDRDVADVCAQRHPPSLATGGEQADERVAVDG